MARIHESLSGQRIEFPDPSPALEAFLAKVQQLVADPKKLENDLIALVYGPENPILAAHPLFPEKKVVTREVLENPVYEVLSDLLVRKRLQIEGVDPQSLGARFKTPVKDAAEQLGISPAAVRKAIADKRLASWIRDGQHFLDPRSLYSLRAGKLANAVVGESLKYHAGYDPESKTTFRVQVHPHPDALREEWPEGWQFKRFQRKGEFSNWRRALVLSGHGGSLRSMMLVPSEHEEKFELEGFYVRGKFTITRKENNPRAAREAWEVFGREQERA